MAASKPSPIMFTEEEGGLWRRWNNQAKDFHTVVFEDGTVFDSHVGWRPRKLCPHCGNYAGPILGDSDNG